MRKASSTAPEKLRAARDRRQTVAGVEMGMEVLKALASMGGTATLTGLSNKVNESPAKVHRYLASLVASGMVTQDASASRYALGPETINVGLTAVRRMDVVSCSEPVLRMLAERHNVSCCLGILGNAGPVIVRWEEPPSQPVTVNVRIGSVLPVIWSATGRVFAAFEPPGALEEAIQLEVRRASPEQRKLLPTRKAVDAMIEEVRARGCASIRGVLLPGINAIAVPVFDAMSRLAGVITALGVDAIFNADPDGDLGRRLKQCGAEVSGRMGYDVRRSRE